MVLPWQPATYALAPRSLARHARLSAKTPATKRAKAFPVTSEVLGRLDEVFCDWPVAFVAVWALLPSSAPPSSVGGGNSLHQYTPQRMKGPALPRPGGLFVSVRARLR